MHLTRSGRDEWPLLGLYIDYVLWRILLFLLERKHATEVSTLTVRLLMTL